MARLRMNDNQWQRIGPMIPDSKPGGRPPLDRRVILDGILGTRSSRKTTH